MRCTLPHGSTFLTLQAWRLGKIRSCAQITSLPLYVRNKGGSFRRSGVNPVPSAPAATPKGHPQEETSATPHVCVNNTLIQRIMPRASNFRRFRVRAPCKCPCQSLVYVSSRIKTSAVLPLPQSYPCACHTADCWSRSASAHAYPPIVPVIIIQVICVLGGY